MDLQTEHDLFKSIHDFLASKTTIVITHRLSTIIDSDIIYVMNNGQIAEQGTHNDLVQLNGIYYSLFTLQQSKDD